MANARRTSVTAAVLLVAALLAGCTRRGSDEQYGSPSPSGSRGSAPGSTGYAASDGTGTTVTEPGTIEVGGRTRTYLLHVPAHLSAPLALVVNLHGGGGTGVSAQRLTHFDDVADRHGFLVVYPDGTDQNWADGRGASAPDKDGVDDVGFIVALVDRLIAEHGVDPGWVFATGLSNGGFMSNRLGCDGADRFAAIAPAAGTLGVDVPCRPSRPVSVLAIHGTADPIVPFDGGRMIGRGGASTIVSAPDQVARWRELDGCPAAGAARSLADPSGGTSVERTVADDCRDGTAVQFDRVVGGGHTWPGGWQYLPAAVIGPTSQAYDASETVWAFFAAHHR